MPAFPLHAQGVSQSTEKSNSKFAHQDSKIGNHTTSSSGNGNSNSSNTADNEAHRAISGVNTAVCHAVVTCTGAHETDVRKVVAYVQGLLTSGTDVLGGSGIARIITVLRALLLHLDPGPHIASSGIDINSENDMHHESQTVSQISRATTDLLQTFAEFYSELHTDSDAKARCATFACELVTRSLDSAAAATSGECNNKERRELCML